MLVQREPADLPGYGCLSDCEHVEPKRKFPARFFAAMFAIVAAVNGVGYLAGW